MNFNLAKSLIQETMDSAFQKKAGTKEKRIALASRLCSRVDVGSDNQILMVWAADYAAKWAA